MLYLLPVLLLAFAKADFTACNAVVVGGVFGYPSDTCVGSATTSTQFICQDDDTVDYVLYSSKNCAEGTATSNISDYCSGGTFCTAYCGNTGDCTIGTIDYYASTDCSGDLSYSIEWVLGICIEGTGTSAKLTCDGGAMVANAYTSSDCSGDAQTAPYPTDCTAGVKYSCEAGAATLKLFVAMIAVFIASLF